MRFLSEFICHGGFDDAAYKLTQITSFPLPQIQVKQQTGAGMDKKKVWITRAIYPDAVKPLLDRYTVEIWPGENPPPKEVFLEKIASLDGILTMLTDPISHEVIQAAQHLQVISQMAVGFDNIDVAAATQRKIPVGHTPGVLTETTADLTWALMMAASRRVVEADRQVHQGIWKPWGPSVLTGYDLYGATLGIIGMGRIGQAVARRARGFSMRVLYYNRHRDAQAEQELGVEYAPLDDLLAQADFISLHMYASPETYHFINAERLAKMKPRAILVNTARGSVIDIQALMTALQTGQIRAAGLDVFDPEPIPANHPILQFENVVITPHIGSGGIQARQDAAVMAVENLLAGLAGQRLPHCANPQVYPV